MSFLRKILDTVGIVQTNSYADEKSGAILDSDVGQDLIAFLATQRAGKTTHSSGLLACIQYKASGSAKTDRKFRYYLDEGGARILHQIGELRAGHFPPATTAGKRVSVKPGFTLEWETPTLFGSRVTAKRQVKSKLLDLAGEDLVKLLSSVSNARNFEQASQIKIDDELINTVNQATALFVIIKATRAEGLPISEPEPTNIEGMSTHSDANLAGMINAILTFKHNNHYSPRLKRFYIVVTACDELFPIAKTIEQITGRPFNPLDPKISSESLESFVRAFFPSTHSTICSMQIKTRYFPSFFELERDSRGQPVPWTEGGKDWKIKRGNIFDTPDWENNVNRPKFSEYWFNQEIDALEDLAVSV
jgi:hypothetical protein